MFDSYQPGALYILTMFVIINSHRIAPNRIAEEKCNEKQLPRKLPNAIVMRQDGRWWTEKEVEDGQSKRKNPLDFRFN